MWNSLFFCFYFFLKKKKDPLFFLPFIVGRNEKGKEHHDTKDMWGKLEILLDLAVWMLRTVQAEKREQKQHAEEIGDSLVTCSLDKKLKGRSNSARLMCLVKQGYQSKLCGHRTASITSYFRIIASFSWTIHVPRLKYWTERSVGCIHVFLQLSTDSMDSVTEIVTSWKKEKWNLYQAASRTIRHWNMQVHLPCHKSLDTKPSVKSILFLRRPEFSLEICFSSSRSGAVAAISKKLYHKLLFFRVKFKSTICNTSYVPVGLRQLLNK